MGLDHPLPFRLSRCFVMSIDPPLPPRVVYLAETLLSPFTRPLKNPFFLRLAFGHVPGQLWTTSQAIACPLTEYVRREEKWKSMPVQPHGTLTALCSWTQTGPGEPSKVPSGSACGVFHHRVRSGGAPLCTQSSICPVVFRLLQSMGTPSILFRCTEGSQSFQGLGRPEIPPLPGERRHDSMTL